MSFDVSFPPKALNPNKRNRRGGQWPGRTAAKAYKNEVYWSAKEALQRGWVTVPAGDRINLHLTFTPPVERGAVWDDDNMTSAFKAGRDGLALAIGVDDRHFRQTFDVLPRNPACKLGKVTVELRPIK